VVFDRHTNEGQRALSDVARDLHMQLPQLEWCYYYFEGADTNAEHPSPWWQRYCRWNFRRIGLSPEEAFLLWEPARDQLIDALAGDGHRLQNELYRWKLANLERIDTLKRQVEYFITHLDAQSRDQTQLF
jgi:hypothetical protein